jgi:PAS domain S-box-containing protein
MFRSNPKTSHTRQFRLPHPNLTTQVYLFVLALTLALLVLAGVAWIDAERQSTLHFENDIEASLQVFQSDFNRAISDLTALGNWLVAQKTLVDQVQSHDGPGLARFLQPWTEVNIADSILVTDKEGLLIAQVGMGPPALPGTDMSNLPGLRDALLGKKTTGLAPDAAGRLEGRLVLPIYASDSQSPIGAIDLGFYADGSFLKYQARQPDQEIALVYNDQMTILTLTDQQGKPWSNTAPPPQVLQALREGHASDYTTVGTDVGTYLFKFEPFESPSSAKIGMYGVGVPVSALNNEQQTLFRTFGLGILLIAIGTCVVGILFARALGSPLRTLGGAAEAIAKGDLSNRIILRRDDELGDLARQMEGMRQQLRQAFEMAELEKSRYAAVIRDMGVAAVVTDHNLNIVSLNPVAEALLGESQAHLQNKSWREVFVDGDGSGARSPFWDLSDNEITNGQNFALRGRLALRAKPYRSVEVISTQVEVKGVAAGYVHILRDISAQEHLTRAQDEFIMNAAHELRGPLASLRASIELLVEDFAVMPPQEMAVMIKTLQRAVVKFQGLVENIIDIGNVQAGRFRIRPMPTPLESMISDALSQVGPLLAGRGQQARVNIECAAPLFVLADRLRIIQVLINLVTNASKYGPEGEPIDVCACIKDAFALVEVTDRGPGIALEEQAHIFQRFYRGRRAEEEGLGIGLGLALAREIVTAHGGRIDVNSKIGEGTTFWFTLPRTDQKSGV